MSHLDDLERRAWDRQRENHLYRLDRALIELASSLGFMNPSDEAWPSGKPRPNSSVLVNLAMPLAIAAACAAAIEEHDDSLWILKEGT